MSRSKEICRSLLISPSSSRRTNATFGGCDASSGIERVEMNPRDAQRLNLEDGQTVRLWNDQGAVALHLCVTDAVLPGVLYSPKGTWLRTSKTGSTVNAADPVAYQDRYRSWRLLQ